jgi:hypothetical protein
MLFSPTPWSCYVLFVSAFPTDGGRLDHDHGETNSLVCERHSDVSLATFAGGSLGKWQSLWSRQGQVERGAFRLRDPECGSYSSLEHCSYTLYKMSQAKKWYFLLQFPAPSRTTHQNVMLRTWVVEISRRGHDGLLINLPVKHLNVFSREKTFWIEIRLHISFLTDGFFARFVRFSLTARNVVQETAPLLWCFSMKQRWIVQLCHVA